jgi:hypothetical protein
MSAALKPSPNPCRGTMSRALTAVTIARSEKAAVDNGFVRELPRQGQWLGFASTQAPLCV